MSIEAEVNADTAVMLRTIKRYALVTPSSEYVVFGLSEKLGVNLVLQRKILHKLEHEGVIKIARAFVAGPMWTMLETLGYEPDTYHLQLLEPFNEAYRRYVGPEAPVQLVGTSKVQFDDRTGILRIGTQQCQVPQVNPHVLAKQLFVVKPLGERLEEEDVADNLRQRGTGRRTFRDAVGALNKLIESEFGIVDLLKYERNSVYVKTELLR